MSNPGEGIVATIRVPAVRSEEHVPEGKELIDYEQALAALTAEERLQATVYAINTLLIQKGVYSAAEFEFQFRQGAARQIKKRR